MSITHLKKQARKLQQLLPSHLLEHPGGGSLTVCQNLDARTHGYPSFHAASSHLAVSGSEHHGRKQNNPAQILCGLHADAHSLKKRIAEIEATEKSGYSQSEAAWRSRSLAFVTAVLPLIVYCTASNRPVGTDFFTLLSLEKLLETEIGKIDCVCDPLTQWMESLPGYKSPKLRNNESIEPLIEPRINEWIGSLVAMVPSMNGHWMTSIEKQT